ncbi:unnamed protein product [Closterium sp. NIES-53]
MAAQELRWLTYLLTDLGEPPRSPPVLFVDNKAMLALCREQRLEHRTKHIALRYFLARELQQRGQLRLAYVASEANTADVFTKALAPCDHQRFCTQLGLGPQVRAAGPQVGAARPQVRAAGTAVPQCQQWQRRGRRRSRAAARCRGVVTELLGFAAACRLDYATALVAESASASPPFVGGECALGTNVFEDKQEDFECLTAAVPCFASMLLAPEGDSNAPHIPTPRSYAEAITGTYIDEVPPPGANIVDGMWIFRGVDYFQTFSPTPKMTTLWVLLHVAAQRDYELHSLDFSTNFLQGSLHNEILLRRPPGFTGSFPAGTHWSLCRPVYGLRQAPREWHHALRTTRAALGFAPSTPDPSLFLRTDASMPPFYVLVYVDNLVFSTSNTEALALVKSELQKRHTCTDLGELRSYLGLEITRDKARRTITLTQSHIVHQVLQRFGFQFSSPLALSSTFRESVEPSGPYPELVGCLMYLMTCTRPDLAYSLSLLARYVALGRHRKVHWDAAKRVLCYLCRTSGMGLVLGGRDPVVLTGHADASWADNSATQWSAASSPPVLYVGNKAMIALCQEHILEHRTKHIALRYFLAQESQQRGQLRLAYVATRANTADVFTKALLPAALPQPCPTLGTDVLEDRQEEFECFAAAVPHLMSMLLAPEGDPDAPHIPTPRSYAEAIEGPYSSQWQAAMDAGMASWNSTGTYVDEVPPPGANIVSGMWIFRVKQPPGCPPVFKARYVARGFSQRQEVDFFHTFSPTPKMSTLRVLHHVAAQRDYELHSLDFSTAFLQGSLHEEIWLRRPPGFTGSFPAGTQWSLRWPVYDLRQAPREWHDTLRTTLAALGFAPSTADPSLFLRTDTTLPPLYVLVYVDDLVFATADTEALAHVKSELQKRHTCTDLGELTSYLGLRITRDRAQHTITLTQSHMVQQVLQRFGFTDSSPRSTPLPTGHSLSAPPSDESVEPSGPYPELVGCLMYLMTCTRPDLAYPLSLLARYVAPGRHRKVHWDAAKRVLRYLCSTSGMGLVLGGRARVVLTGHAVASWVDDLATQRSSQGYTFSLGSGFVS